MLEPSEIEGESLQWALDYLCQTHDCPPGLAEHVSREAFRRVQLELGPGENGKDTSLRLSPVPQCGRVELRQLQRETETQVYKVCREWKRQLPGHVRPLTPASPLLPVSSHAIKNTRRRMEDRHVVLPDITTLFQLQDSPSQSYYAVFDGHAGAEAAMFSASQLHVNLLRDPNFASNPELALKRAYTTTDRQFAKKAEEQKLRSGSTGVSVLLRGEHCYISWLGDSQVMLVQEGRAVTLMAPHKPNREDEKRRIEELGGFVTNAFGVWRVNGSVAVSRAIGDIHEKPFLCSDADTTSFERTGTEDYLVLGCDGVWDVLAPVDIPGLVHSYLTLHPEGHRHVARHLVTCAKDKGSGDNISCVVVFLRRDVARPAGPPPVTAGFQFGLRENGEHSSPPLVGGGQQGSGAGGDSSSAVAHPPSLTCAPSSSSDPTNISRLTLNSSVKEVSSDGVDGFT
ncbi:protein phosphatase 1F-like [Babylonia areolata]|uniref:protein phosphatase 1F-like n=1 Tax=Babylonia areolata TaxID=304850 RepID=UPI003FD65364